MVVYDLFKMVFGDGAASDYTSAKASAKAAGADEFDAGARFAVAQIKAALARRGSSKMPVELYDDVIPPLPYETCYNVTDILLTYNRTSEDK